MIGMSPTYAWFGNTTGFVGLHLVGGPWTNFGLLKDIVIAPKRQMIFYIFEDGIEAYAFNYTVSGTCFTFELLISKTNQ